MKLIKGITLMIALMTGLSSFAQDNSKYGDTPEKQQVCLEAMSVYRSFRDTKNPDVYQSWQEACKVCPPDVSERLYSDGVKFIRAERKKAKKAKNMERVAILEDSLLQTYDLRINYFGSTSKKPNNACTIKGLKANDMYSYMKDEKLEEANALFKEAIDCLKEETMAGVLSGYYLSLKDLYMAAEGEKKDEYMELLLGDYLILQEYCQFGFDNSSKEKTKDGYMKSKNNMDEIFVGIANCEEMIPILQKKVAAEPDDFELKKKAMRLMTRKDCTEDPFYLQMAEAVHEIEPGHESGYALGQIYLKKSNLNKALAYFEQAAELCTDCPDREKYLLRSGQVASSMNKTSKAKSYARKVLDINPNSGDAYLLIGDAIAGSSSACDDGKLGARSVYWLAVDYYAKAKNVDPDVSSKANKKIGNASAQFPSREDLFAFGIKAGDSFTTCLGESTTVRER